MTTWLGRAGVGPDTSALPRLGRVGICWPQHKGQPGPMAPGSRHASGHASGQSGLMAPWPAQHHSPVTPQPLHPTVPKLPTQSQGSLVPWHPYPMHSLGPWTAQPHGPPVAGRLWRSLALQFIVGKHENTVFVVTEPRRNDSSSVRSRCGTAGTAPVMPGLSSRSDPDPAGPAHPGHVQLGTKWCNRAKCGPQSMCRAGQTRCCPRTGQSRRH